MVIGSKPKWGLKSQTSHGLPIGKPHVIIIAPGIGTLTLAEALETRGEGAVRIAEAINRTAKGRRSELRRKFLIRLWCRMIGTNTKPLT